jgi:hypothetical protein
MLFQYCFHIKATRLNSLTPPTRLSACHSKVFIETPLVPLCGFQRKYDERHFSLSRHKLLGGGGTASTYILSAKVLCTCVPRARADFATLGNISTRTRNLLNQLSAGGRAGEREETRAISDECMVMRLHPSVATCWPQQYFPDTAFVSALFTHFIRREQ